MESLTVKFCKKAMSKMAGVPKAVISGTQSVFGKTANAFKEGGPALGQALEKIANSKIVKAVANTAKPKSAPSPLSP